MIPTRIACLCAGMLLASFAMPHAAAAQGLPPGYNCLTANDGDSASPLFISDCQLMGQGGSSSETQAYLGLSWAFDADLDAPQFLTGIRRVEDAGNGHVRGADLSLSWDVKDRFALRDARLGYLTGRPDAIIALGAGYAPATKETLLTASVDHGPVRIGADYGLGSQKVKPFISLTSLEQPDLGGAGCASGYSEAIPDTTGQNGVIVFINNPLPFDPALLAPSFCLLQGDRFNFPG